jgi:hypothetical protein
MGVEAAGMRRRTKGAALDEATLNDLIRILMRIDAKLDDVPAILREDDNGEEETDL